MNLEEFGSLWSATLLSRPIRSLTRTFRGRLIKTPCTLPASGEADVVVALPILCFAGCMLAIRAATPHEVHVDMWSSWLYVSVVKGTLPCSTRGVFFELRPPAEPRVSRLAGRCPLHAAGARRYVVGTGAQTLSAPWRKIVCSNSEDSDTQGALFTFVVELLDRVQVQCQHAAAALDAFRKVARDGREVCMSILGVNPIERTELVLSVANEGSFDDACVPQPERLEFWPDSTRRLEYLGGWHVRCGQTRTGAFGWRPVVLGRKLPCSTTFGHQ